MYSIFSQSEKRKIKVYFASTFITLKVSKKLNDFLPGTYLIQYKNCRTKIAKKCEFNSARVHESLGKWSRRDSSGYPDWYGCRF